VTLERYRPFIDDWTSFTEAAARPEPTVFRVRSGRVDADALVDRLAAQGIRTRVLAGLPDFYQVETSPVPVSMTFEHWAGLIYVQQASTGVAAPALGPRPGERILDLCAAPGGKTTHMAELMRDEGCLVASEISESRIRGLLGNVYRLGHTGVMVVAGDGRDFPVGARFDRVLVDAPCTGEGTLRRRRAGEPARPSRSFLAYVTGAQRALLERAVRLTRPGGTVLYVTCTFSPDENEAVVHDALQRLPVELEALDLQVPHAPGLTAFEGERYDRRLEGAARIYPHHLDSGGLFLARLRRLDDGAACERSAGWSPVPRTFPDPDSAAHSDSAANGASAPKAESAKNGASALGVAERERPAHGVAEAQERYGVADEALLARGVAEVQERFGVRRELGELGWLMRGGRAWMHTLSEWPLEGWSPGDWRAISVGVRSIEFDSRSRARPTNDLLRILDRDVSGRVIDVSPADLDALLRREVVTTDIEDRGPYALRFEGEIVGRGAVTKDGLKSEIPKVRAADLLRIRKGPDDA